MARQDPRSRAEFYYQQLDELRSLRQQVRRELLAESAKHQGSKLLCQIPSIGPIRAAQLIAILQTPNRFRSKRQLWAYGGLVIETHSSADHRYVDGQLGSSCSPTYSILFTRWSTITKKKTASKSTHTDAVDAR